MKLGELMVEYTHTHHPLTHVNTHSHQDTHMDRVFLFGGVIRHVQQTNKLHTHIHQCVPRNHQCAPNGLHTHKHLFTHRKCFVHQWHQVLDQPRWAPHTCAETRQGSPTHQGCKSCTWRKTLKGCFAVVCPRAVRAFCMASCRGLC